MPSEDEIARLRVEKDQGASPAGSGYSAEPEPVPVSALTGEYPSRELYGKLVQFTTDVAVISRSGKEVISFLVELNSLAKRADALLRECARDERTQCENRKAGRGREAASPARREAPNTLHTNPNPKREDR